MMGQFVVLDNSSLVSKTDAPEFTIYPNPAQDKLFIAPVNFNHGIYYVTIRNVLGRTMMMLPKPNMQSGIDISALAAGIYSAEITEDLSKARTVIQFIKN